MVRDRVGQPILYSSLITYATKYGNNPILKVGVVKKINDDGTLLVAPVSTGRTWGENESGRMITLMYPKNTTVVAGFVDPEVVKWREALNG